MLGESVHVEHYQLGPAKDVRVDALEDKILVLQGIQSDEESVINVAAAIFLDVQDAAGGLELLCDGDEMIFVHLGSVNKLLQVSCLCRNDRNSIYFDQQPIAKQAPHFDGRTSRWPFRIHELIANLAHDLYLRYVQQIVIELDDAVEIRTDSFEGCFQMGEHLMRLCAQIILANQGAGLV